MSLAKRTIALQDHFHRPLTSRISMAGKRNLQEFTLPTTKSIFVKCFKCVHLNLGSGPVAGGCAGGGGWMRYGQVCFWCSHIYSPHLASTHAFVIFCYKRFGRRITGGCEELGSDDKRARPHGAQLRRAGEGGPLLRHKSVVRPSVCMGGVVGGGG